MDSELPSEPASGEPSTSRKPTLSKLDAMIKKRTEGIDHLYMKSGKPSTKLKPVIFASNRPPGEPPSPTTRHLLKLKAIRDGKPKDDDPNILFKTWRCVVKRHEDIVTKSGIRVHIEETNALNLASQLGLPVPQVHKIETLPPPEHGMSISMDYVSGETLEAIWKSLSADEKRSMALQLREIIDKMRSLASDSNGIRGCGGGRVVEERFYDFHPGGPFPDEKSFNDFWVEMKRAPTAIVEACHRRLRSDHRIVFTHGDIAPSNIIVRDMKIVGLVDWEFAGWFPEYWEYVKFFQHRTSHRDWCEYSKVIFSQKYDDELVDYQAISYWQRW